MTVTPEIVTRVLPTVIVSTTELSLDFLITRLPAAPFWTGSLNVITRFAVNVTPVASSAGVRLTTVGFSVSMPNLFSGV